MDKAIKKVLLVIYGAHCVGKSTVAKHLIKKCGGITSSTKAVTRVADPKWLFAGKYVEGAKFGGVDSWSATKPLESFVKNGLATHDILVCEGSFLRTTGKNIVNAVYYADVRITCLLYAPYEVIAQRLQARTGTPLTDENAKNQQCAIRTYQRWKEMGVKALAYDTSKLSAEQIGDMLYNEIMKYNE